jgi:hypothetical protein
MSGVARPVVVGLSGGLGNQMFQYAAGRSLATRLGAPLVLDLTWFCGQGVREFVLDRFHINASLHTRYPWLLRPGRAFLSRVTRRWFPRIMGVPVWRESHLGSYEALEGLRQPVYLEGYWQSEKYFLEASELLVQDFAMVDAMPAACEAILHDMQSHDAICVHVRRGDYVSNPVAAATHGTLSIEYYKRGVAEICAASEKPKCYVFSDDHDWVSANLSFNCPMVVVDINGPAQAHLDLMLMASCKHFVIANSSLSWWGAWLGNFHQKRVIAPRRWFLSNAKEARDLLPDSWLQR